MITKKSAVIAKSTPVPSNGRMSPSSAPMPDPRIQYDWSSAAIAKRNLSSSTPSGTFAA